MFEKEIKESKTNSRKREEHFNVGECLLQLTILYTRLSFLSLSVKVRGKSIRVKAMDSHRVVRRQVYHIVYRVGSQMAAGRPLPPKEDSWYLFLIDTESTPGSQCGWKG
jgi:hypothetical protein